MKGTNADAQSKDWQKMADQMKVFWLSLAVEVVSQDQSVLQDHFQSQGSVMMDAYLQKFKQGRALRGNMFADPVVRSDLKYCRDIIEATQ